MLRLYNLGLLPLRAAATLWARWPSAAADRGRERSERLARVVPRARAGGWWVHGASLGEAGIVRLVVREARRREPDRPLYVSAVTRTGRGALPEPPDVEAAFFAPLDFAGLPGRVLDALGPRGLVLVETELWPNLLHEAHGAGARVAVVNARLAPERMRRYRRFGALFRSMLGVVDAIGAQSDADAERFAELGAPRSRIEVTGNVKYDLPPLPVGRDELRRRFGLERTSREVVVAGSTARGEDGIVLDAFLDVRRHRPGLLLFLAPRHPERSEECVAAVERRGLSFSRLSDGEPSAAARADVVVVDTVGELGSLYALADACFVGGSLVPVGGHNVLEPIRAGVAPAFGPHTGHVAEPAAALLEVGAAIRVTDAPSLARAWRDLIGDPPRAGRAVDAGRAVLRRSAGALDRTLDLLETTFGTEGGS